MPHNKIKIITVIIILVVVLLLGLFGKKLGIFENNYSIIHLTTGEVYIGKLTLFPGLKLKDAYILQVTKDVMDSTKNNFQLQPIKDALWAPESLHLVKENIVFYGPLMSESVIAKKLAEQEK